MKKPNPRKLSVKEQKQLLPDAAVKAAFMNREDIAALPAKDANARWLKHLAKIDDFRKLLSGVDTFVVEL